MRNDFTGFFFFKNINLLKKYDCFYLTFDEPEKEQRWNTIKKLIPHAQWVDNIEGFDKAHKECARRSNTERLTIIDGDNQFLSPMPVLRVPRKILQKKYVLSYSSENNINGLSYGNGGLKSWPRDVLLSSKTHEESTDEEGAVDFCFKIPYYQMPESPTQTIINLTPYQAFRAGYREGVKMSLLEGKVINFHSNTDNSLKNLIPRSNYYRLKVWLEVGRDIPNGLWAIYGARLGLMNLINDKRTLSDIREYSWFKSYWDSLNPKENLEFEIIELGRRLAPILGEPINEYDASESFIFKKTMNNPRREGIMIPSLGESNAK
jgi:hypothetical protein